MDPDLTEKRREIEECLADLDGTNLEQWQNFAKSKGGLISGKLSAYLYMIQSMTLLTHLLLSFASLLEVIRGIQKCVYKFQVCGRSVETMSVETGILK